MTSLMNSSEYEDREQTAVKHKILERYLSGLVPIVGNWASDVAYIDCLAGPWESTDAELKDTSFARAVKVLRETREVLKRRGRHPSMRCLFIENNSSAFPKLKRYCDAISDIETRAEAWDFTEHIDDIVKFSWERSGSFPFVFIDPTGWEPLGIEMIRPILALKPGEVLINLMTSFILRFLDVPGKGFERLFGDDLPRLISLSGEDQEDELVSSYANRVRAAGGFNYICTLPVMKSNKDAFQFHMIYGTRHPEGVEVFKGTEKHVIPFMHNRRAQAQERRRLSQTGQPGLFAPETLYKETRFTRYRNRNLNVAKLELQEKLQASGKLSYDDAWATAMQHATVMEADLREWLEEWTADGLLDITNKRSRQKFPSRGTGQYLIWKNGAAK
ncbi:MAG: three-Cys-motif partner protein TcmP [Candidatus Acidiferrales bacterium]